MANDNIFHTLTRHRLTSATLICALVEADRCERTPRSRGDSSSDDRRSENNRSEHSGSNHSGSAHLWPSDIGFGLSPSNAWLIQIMQDEIATNHPARIQRMSLLEHDQQRLLAGWRPNSRDLDDAPSIIPDTLFVTSGDKCRLINLAGFVRNVPGGGPDRRRVTSLVVAFDAAQFRWIRTLSRFYRLDPIPIQPVNECPTE
jgi:hypothetical protein